MRRRSLYQIWTEESRIGRIGLVYPDTSGHLEIEPLAFIAMKRFCSSMHRLDKCDDVDICPVMRSHFSLTFLQEYLLA